MDLIPIIVAIITFLGGIISGLLLTIFSTWLNERVKRKNKIYERTFEAYEKISSSILSFVLYINAAPLNFREQPEFQNRYRELAECIRNNNIFVSKKLLSELEPILLSSRFETEHGKLHEAGHKSLELIRLELGISGKSRYWKEKVLFFLYRRKDKRKLT